MLPLGTARAAARKSRIFGGFPRFLTRYDKDPSDLSRPTKPGLLFAVHGQPVAGSLPAAGAFCPPVGGCRLADHGQGFAGWYVWGMGRGAWRGLFNSFKRATSAS